MTPDEFAGAVARLAAENKFVLQSLTFNSAGRQVGGTHSYRGVSIGTFSEPYGVVLHPDRDE